VGAELDATTGFATAAVPVGGNGAVLVAGEIRVRTDLLLKNGAIVVFVDASRVTDDAEIPLAKLPEFAPGLGLRYVTPFGPLRFDVAVLVNPADGLALAPRSDAPATPVSSSCDSSARTCVYEPRWAWHLTLGEAF
jgi:translocation and assembly module TamA